MMTEEEKYRIPLFDGTNFSNWKFRMEVLLEEMDLAQFLEGPYTDMVKFDEKKKGETAEEKTEREKKLVQLEKKKCKSQIIRRMGDSHLEYAKDKENSYELWSSLCNVLECKRIARQLLIRKSLLTIKFESTNDTLGNYFLEFDKSITDLRSTGATLEETDIVRHLLLTMPNEYEGVTTALQTLSKEDLTFNFVKNRLLEEELKRRSNGVTKKKVILLIRWPFHQREIFRKKVGKTRTRMEITSEKWLNNKEIQEKHNEEVEENQETEERIFENTELSKMCVRNREDKVEEDIESRREYEIELRLKDEVKSSKKDEVVTFRKSEREKQKPTYLNDYAVLAESFVNNVPTCYEETETRQDKQEWFQVVQEEIESPKENDIWELIKLPPGKKFLDSKWVFKIKEDKNGNVERYKVRLVIKSCAQRKGYDYEETYAPVARLTTLRTLIFVIKEKDLYACQTDVKNAFLHGKIKKEIYIKIQSGFVCQDKNLMCKLKKALYGLKQAPRAWNETFDEFAKHLGFEQSEADKCLYAAKFGKVKLHLLLYQTHQTEQLWKGLKKILRYIEGSLDLGLWFKKGKKESLLCYARADLGSEYDRKSTIALSSTESEYITLAMAVPDLLWLKKLLEDFGVSLSIPLKVFENNQSCSHLLHKWKHRRHKHVDVKRKRQVYLYK
ncbi:hypothetical protein ILUMI_17120 [Ignelater luminosus]|uniref:Reverse transcriptase Ty1/copia-type domain-containing protein n=1 Tax=Ignelater luminosus TaxID=2038154 RepID=A0A8K0CR17_IGNLU|nr:hypothetical protein ILUMI_17120 [Ignelater luminosus]